MIGYKTAESGYSSPRAYLPLPQIEEMPNNLDPEDFYKSPEGFIVFTEKYHLKRGYCCQSGCKHCPYGFDKRTGTIRKK